MAEKPEDGEKSIIVNGRKIYIKEDSLTTKEILERAELDPEQYDLYLVIGQNSEKQKPDKSIEIKNDRRFNAIRQNVVYG